MKILTLPPSGRGARRQRGFTLVEMMVAVGIGLVVALGFAVSFVNLKSTWNNQDKLAQLQDNERLAMAFLTSSIEEAGYYPDATKTSLIMGTTATSGSMAFGTTATGQAMTGTPTPSGSSTTPLSLSTQYLTASGDGVLNCQGGTNASGANVTYRNVFYVNTATQTLNCVLFTNGVIGSDAALISNVSSMNLMYAVDSDGDGSADKYLAADAVTTAGLWSAVKSVQVTLNFVNPNSSSTPITWVQTINAMNNR